MTTTSSASVTRLPTAAARKVRNPTAARCRAAIIEQAIPKLPNRWQKEARETSGLADVIDTIVTATAERALIHAILRSVPAWQARNVRRLVGLVPDDAGFAARLIAADALSASLQPDEATR